MAAGRMAWGGALCCGPPCGASRGLPVRPVKLQVEPHPRFVQLCGGGARAQNKGGGSGWMSVGLCLQVSVHSIAAAQRRAAVYGGRRLQVVWCRSPHGRMASGTRLSSTVFQASGGAVQVPKVWTYFAIHREWCDHILFYEDGSFAQGRLEGFGSWHMVERRSEGTVGYSLAMSWQRGTSILGDASAELLSVGGSTAAFAAKGLRLESAGGELLPAAGTSPRSVRGLLFSSVGSQCLSVVQDHWLAMPSQMEFDVVLVFYKEASSRVFKELSLVADMHANVHVQHSPGMKWPNFMKWMALQGGPTELVAKYDYVWVVDDDVRLHTLEINRMFRILREHAEIQFACPSFDAGSDGVWRYFDGHNPQYKLRYTDFVECTAPVLKASMLLDPGFGRCLQAVRTGCFIDFCFFPATGRRKDAVAILDAVQCHHPPRGPDAPSEMRQVKRWEDHKEDDVFFEQAGVPREWYWFRQPQVFGGVPAEPAAGP